MHFRSPVNLTSIALASASAGPAFLSAMAISIWMLNPATPIEVAAAPGEIAAACVLLIAAILVGAVAGFIPNLIGTMVMTWLGDRNAAMRLPVAWAIAGGLSAGLPAAIGGHLVGDDRLWPVALAATGTVCALICRIGIHWHDERQAPSVAVARIPARCVRDTGDDALSQQPTLLRRDFLR